MKDKTDRTDKEPPQRYSVPALNKALDVLELLSDRAESMSQTDIGRALGRSSSEIFRTLSALETRGYIRRTQAGQFRLTLKLFELSRTHSPYEELLRVAQPIMRALAEEAGETCHLTALREGEVVVLAQVESPKPVRLSVEIGSRHSPLTTTSGRILLASMDDDERNRFLETETDFPNLPEDIRNSLLTRVRTVQERGYETADGERYVGGLDVGALVGHPGSTIKAALVVATLRSAQGPDPDVIREAVIATAHKISVAAGLD